MKVAFYECFQKKFSKFPNQTGNETKFALTLFSNELPSRFFLEVQNVKLVTKLFTTSEVEPFRTQGSSYEIFWKNNN